MNIRKILATTIIVIMSGIGGLFAQDMTMTTERIHAQLEAKQEGAVFPIGEYNSRNAAHFTGDSYVARLTQEPIPVANVTFVNGAHTYWHVHHGSCQLLLAVSGRGYYQIWGQEPQPLRPGMAVTIPEGTVHWHGAAPNTTFQHIAVMQSNTSVTTEWLDEVNPDEYEKLQ